MTDGHTGRLESALAGRYKIQRKLGDQIRFRIGSLYEHDFEANRSVKKRGRLDAQPLSRNSSANSRVDDWPYPPVRSQPIQALNIPPAHMQHLKSAWVSL